MTNDSFQKEDSQIPTNLRLLRILEEVVRMGGGVKPSDINELIGLPKPTIHRLLQTAEAEGFLQRDIDGRSYGPGNRLRTLAINTISSERARTARIAILKGLADEVKETVNLAVPDRDYMTYLERVDTEWPLRIQLPIGTKVPFHCTASGKMYLSTLRSSALNGILAAKPLEMLTKRTLIDPDLLKVELSKIRKNGFSTDNEEFMTAMAAVAVPVFDAQKRLWATLSVHAPVMRCPFEQIINFVGCLKETAHKLSQLHNEDC